MRVLVVTHNYPRFEGDPAGAYVARLASAASAAGASVTVLAPHVGQTAPEETHGEVTVHRFRYAPASWERVGYRGDVRASTLFTPTTLLLLPSYLWAFRRAFRRLMRTLQPDVVHAHWWFPGGWVAAAGNVPYVVTAHGSDARLLEGRLARGIARPVFRGAARVTAASRFLASDLAARIPPLASPILVTPMPVDVERFAAGRTVRKADPPRILYAGNLVAAKGVDVLFRALAELRGRGLACRVKVLGEGPDAPGLRTLASTLNIEGDIDWSNFVTQDHMPAEYGAATITVLPSRGQAEGLGLTLVEALLAGSAVVGSRAGGIPEVVVDGETGFTFPDGDHRVLAEQVGRLLSDPSLRSRLTAAGAARMQQTYAPRNAARTFLDLYEDVRRDHPAH